MVEESSDKTIIVLEKMIQSGENTTAHNINKRNKRGIFNIKNKVAPPVFGL